MEAGWSDLALEGGDILTIGEAPHHCGAGTTAAGLRAGVPTVGVPVLADQPFWARRLVTLGASPAVVPMRKLTAAGLAARVAGALERLS